jgi:hypothetical protein
MGVAVGVVCAGCGQPIADAALSGRGAGRGRPQRYHGPACRQRARRARRTSEHAELLAVLDRLDTTVSSLRRAVLSGADVSALIDELAGITAEVVVTADPRTGSDPTPPIVLPAAEHPGVYSTVTNLVTISRPAVRPTDGADHDVSQPTMPRPHAGAELRGGRVPSTARGTRGYELGYASSTHVALDLDTVRLTRAPQGSAADWYVLAGPEVQPVLVGQLEAKRSLSGSRTRRWTATRPHGTTVPGGPWKTRQDALVHLVDDHLRRYPR